MANNLDNKIYGSLKGAVLFELLTNTIHFPIANVILEVLKSGVSKYIFEMDMYIIFFSCIIQAMVLGRWNYQGKNLRLVGNLVGPFLYTVIEVALEGLEFFDSYNHVTYIVFGLLIGLFQQFQTDSDYRFRNNILLVIENMIRTYIVLVMYVIYEMTDGRGKTISEFMHDESHIYFATVISLLGLVIGFAKVTSEKYLHLLKSNLRTMKVFSEWFLGGKILSEALEDDNALNLKRMERTVVFTDIRGFTAWSEERTPEEVVGMLNKYFEISESVWSGDNVVKIKYTGDEIMVVCKDRVMALLDAVEAAEKFEEYLTTTGLSAGTGIHSGLLVEGMIGGKDVKAYDVIGDTVNTAKRICDKAKGGEILISETTLKNVHEHINVLNKLDIEAKGKADKVAVCRIR